MRIIIILLAAIAIYSTAFYRPKCEHVFTEVEQAELEIERQGWICSVYTPPPTGKHEGKELICVKCFHKQKQILDYGKPIVTPNILRWPSGSLINCCDTLVTWGPTLSSGTNKISDSLRNVILNIKPAPPLGSVFAH
jgi:hypothetical protein